MRSKTIGSSTAASNTGGATADYNSVAAWEASIADVDDETGTWIYAGQLDTSGVTINAANTGGWTYLVTADSSSAITVPTRSEFNSKARIGVASAAQTALDISTTGVIWEKVGVSGSSDASVNAVQFNTAGKIRRTIVIGRGSGTSNIIAVGSGTTTVSNVAGIATATNGNGFVGVFSGVTLALYQCSGFSTSSPSYGAYAAINSAVVNSYACVHQGSGSGWTNSGGTIGGEDNVSQDTTAPGSNTRKSVTGIYRDTGSGTEDLRLWGLNGALLSGVTDRSGTVADLATDISGTSRPRAASFPIDPGCYMVAAGPSVMAYAGVGAVQSSEPMTCSINPPVSNCLLVAAIGVSGDTINAVDFNGTSLSSVAAAAQNNAGLRTYIYTLDNPATGSHTLTVDVNASFSRGWFEVYALKFAGDANIPAVDVGDGNTFTGAATTVSKSTTTAVANEGAIDVWANGSSGSAPVPDSPQAPNNKATSPSFLEAASSTRLAVAAGSTADGWSFNSGSAGALSVVYIKPGSGGGGGASGQPTMRRFGAIRFARPVEIGHEGVTVN